MMASAGPMHCCATRIHGLVFAMDEAARRSTSEGGEGLEVHELSREDSAVALELRNVVLKTPRQAYGFQSLPVIDHASARLSATGASLLIAGESGVGKSSLLRAISGLWSNGSGIIRRPPDEATFFIAQRPFLCLGSLRQQL